VPAGEVYVRPVRVAVPGGAAHGARAIRFELAAVDSPRLRVVEKARFIAP
jgi:hypothetical protein